MQQILNIKPNRIIRENSSCV